MAKILIDDIVELATHLLGEDHTEDLPDLEDRFMDEFNMGLDNFADLLEKLVPLIFIAKSPINEETFKGFGIHDGVRITALLKIKAEE